MELCLVLPRYLTPCGPHNQEIKIARVDLENMTDCFPRWWQTSRRPAAKRPETLTIESRILVQVEEASQGSHPDPLIRWKVSGCMGIDRNLLLGIHVGISI